MIGKLNEPAITERQPVYVLHGISYSPHYTEKHRWVGPGLITHRKVYTTAELNDAGAQLAIDMLWRRSWTEDVTGWKAA